jgi:hypothetical protein
MGNSHPLLSSSKVGPVGKDCNNGWQRAYEEHRRSGGSVTLVPFHFLMLMGFTKRTFRSCNGAPTLKLILK